MKTWLASSYVHVEYRGGTLPENPYSPPDGDPASTPQRSLVCDAMFLLTAILGVCLTLAATWNIFSNFRFLSQNNLGFAPYVIAAATLQFACGVGLLYSAWLWKLSRVRRGLISMSVAGAAMYFGPLLLAELLV